jgi:hypothetical protein
LGKKVSYGFDLQKLGLGKVKVIRVERGVIYRVMGKFKNLNKIYQGSVAKITRRFNGVGNDSS